MTMTAIQETVARLIREACQPNEPDLSDLDKPLLECGLDSLDFATTLLAVEDEFNFGLSSEDIEDLHSVNAIVKVIESKKA